MAKLKTLDKSFCEKIKHLPSFSSTGSIIGMKRLYYGKNALLIKCGKFIYNATSEPHLYEMAK